jgi:hypothetical protein
VVSGGPLHTLGWLHRCYDTLVTDPAGHAPHSAVGGTTGGLLHWSAENDLGAAMLEYALRAGDQETLLRAVSHLRRAQIVVPRAANPQAVVLTNLGLALCATYDHTGRETDLDDAIRVLRHARTAAIEAQVDMDEPASGLPSIPTRLLARALHRRFELTGRQGDLHEAGAVLASVPDPAGPGKPSESTEQWRPVLVRDACPQEGVTYRELGSLRLPGRDRGDDRTYRLPGLDM